MPRPRNALYTSNVFISTQIDIRDRLVLVAWDGVAEPTVVRRRVEEGYPRLKGWVQDIRDY
ncbi:MAG: hypothetical protein AAF493_20035 [Pseudomonadota bacterium]